MCDCVALFCRSARFTGREAGQRDAGAIHQCSHRVRTVAQATWPASRSSAHEAYTAASAQHRTFRRSQLTEGREGFAASAVGRILWHCRLNVCQLLVVVVLVNSYFHFKNALIRWELTQLMRYRCATANAAQSFADWCCLRDIVTLMVACACCMLSGLCA